MWFLLRAVAVIAVIAFLSPHRGGAEREAARLAAEAPARVAAQLPEGAREAALAEAGRAVAQALPTTGSLRGALAPAPR